MRYGLLKLLTVGMVMYLPSPSSFSQASGDAVQGRAIVLSKQTGLCLLCHSAPVDERFQGNLAPNLSLMVQDKTPDQLKQAIQDPSLNHPGTIMPSYGKTDHLQRVARNLEGKPLLSNQQIDDVVAYLLTLQNP